MSTVDRGAHEFTVAASHDVYAGRVMALRVDEVVMPGGGTATREVVEHPGAVGVLALDENDQVVLIHQYRHPVGQRLWELPAGLLDAAGEDPAATAARELAEEVGLAAEDWSVLVDVSGSPGFMDEVIRVYLARGLSTVEQLADTGDEEADLVVRRVPLSEAVRMVLSGAIINAATVSGVLAAHAVLSGAAQARPVEAPWDSRPYRFAQRRDG
ncbi:ADP-ribose pyrophosphatase [Crossiella equi]|uniref:ADP-ribose pyrophosphatase n=1 Tax=Crossiella equi TaxID=130796 RepID=A0ABS5ALI8_9PSEU|nr:NUDIX hydrolase [Crossiella equi]MBP2477442.1 ADP-ribose pyrophosphatase [Crossiella equi]